MDGKSLPICANFLSAVEHGLRIISGLAGCKERLYQLNIYVYYSLNTRVSVCTLTHVSLPETLTTRVHLLVPHTCFYLYHARSFTCTTFGLEEIKGAGNIQFIPRCEAPGGVWGPNFI